MTTLPPTAQQRTASSGGDAPIYDRMAVLADATRGRILRLVERRELAVGELCDVLQAPQSTVSRHLKVLLDGGWLECRRDGTSRRYRLDPGALDRSGRRLWQLVREEVASSLVAAEDSRRLASVLAERRRRSQQFFSSAAGDWDRLRRELFGRGSELGALLGLLDDSWTVGDLGCGTARAALALAPFVRRVVAIDSSGEMLEAARRRLGLPDDPLVANVELRQGEVEALPVDDGELDAALLLLVLHHVVEPADALAEAARAVRPGGRLLVLEMERHEREEYRQEMGHQWLGFEPAELTGWLTAAGFDDPRVGALPADPQARGPALFTISARRNA